MAKYSKTRSPQQRHRRSHSSLDALPPKLRAAVEEMIVNNDWPKDYKRHYNGIPRHYDISAYCKSKGFRFSKSAVGRFAAKIQTVSSQKIAGDFRSFAKAHLGTLCMCYSEMQRDLEISVIGSDRREALEKEQERTINRIERLRASLRKLDNSFPHLIQGG